MDLNLLRLLKTFEIHIFPQLLHICLTITIVKYKFLSVNEFIDLVPQTPVDPSDKRPMVKTIRQFSDDGKTLNVDLICGDVVSKQTFVRIE